MIYKRHISGVIGLILTCTLLAYMLFGDANSQIWSSFYFLNIDLIILWFCYIAFAKGKILSNVAIATIAVISFVNTLFDAYSFFDKLSYAAVNESYLSGGLVLFVVLIVIKLSYGRLVKR